MFTIETAGDFLLKVKDDLTKMEENIVNSGRAMNCILSAYHLHEWVWARWLKAQAPKSIRGAIIRSKDAYVTWLDANCPHFSLLQELTNGTKHCRPVAASTAKIAGYGMGPFGVGPYGVPYLLVDKGDAVAVADRYVVVSDMLATIVSFWTAFFTEYEIPIPAPAVPVNSELSDRQN